VRTHAIRLALIERRGEALNMADIEVVDNAVDLQWGPNII
jgi:hypothetical protein